MNGNEQLTETEIFRAVASGKMSSKEAAWYIEYLEQEREDRLLLKISIIGMGIPGIVLLACLIAWLHQ